MAPAPKLAVLSGNPFEGKPSAVAMSHEFTRWSAGRPLAALDMSRYSVPAPAGGDAAPAEEWRAAASNATAQIGHQAVRSANVELLRRFGPQLWKLSADQLDMVRAALKEEQQMVAAQTMEVNRERKLAQDRWRVTLQRLEGEWQQLVVATSQLERVCAELEASLGPEAAIADLN